MNGRKGNHNKENPMAVEFRIKKHFSQREQKRNKQNTKFGANGNANEKPNRKEWIIHN